MRAINNFIIIEPIKEEPKKVGGLILTDKLNEDVRYIRANVVSVGNETQGVKPNDTIFYDRHAGHDIVHDDKRYKVIRLGDIVVVE